MYQSKKINVTKSFLHKNPWLPESVTGFLVDTGYHLVGVAHFNHPRRTVRVGSIERLLPHGVAHFLGISGLGKVSPGGNHVPT